MGNKSMRILLLLILLSPALAKAYTVTDQWGIEHGTGYEPPNTDILLPKAYESLPTTDLPNAFDSRSLGWISPVKDQGQCGSCWAHAIVENFEDQLLKNTKKLTQLSVAQMIDCDSGAAGCGGGDMAQGFYAVNPGLSLAKDYPYGGGQGWCKNPLPTIAARAKGWKYVGKPNTAPTVDELKAAIMAHASLFVLVSAGGANWDGRAYMYQCGNTYDNHMVEIVGWTAKGEWIMRNSWGTGWGDKGFAYLPFGCDNIATGVGSAAFLEL
jgi:KDEL-tailed cysteine endopeptidase